MIYTMHVCDKCRSIQKPVTAEVMEYELCDECYEELQKKIQGILKEFFGEKEEKPEEDPDEPKKAPMKVPQKKKQATKRVYRGKIDWDKACALKQAGWTNRLIAEELGASEGTINAMIGAKYKEYKAGHRDSAPLKEESEE